jgi:hypothetical protein
MRTSWNSLGETAGLGPGAMGSDGDRPESGVRVTFWEHLPIVGKCRGQSR